MQIETQTDATPFGLFEISDQGIIRHYQPPADACGNGMGAELVGRNFYNAIAPHRRANELRERVLHFKRSRRPTESFDFAIGGSGNGDLVVRMLLTTIQERTAEETTQSVLIHIRPA
jgi:hypothetical protein